MIQRIVCFKFVPGASAAAIEAHMRHFAQLADTIVAIGAYRGGRTTPERGEPPAYDSVHTLLFADQAAVDHYVDHPEHQAFIAANRAIWQAVLVLNSTVSDVRDPPNIAAM